MGNNSIRSNLGKDDILCEIDLTIKADISREKTFLVLEGWDDIAFFHGKTGSSVELFESFSGKDGVVEIVKHFSNKRVLGVCDRDYVNNSQCDEIFYYDFNCLEIMLASNDSSFRAVVNVHYYGDLECSELRLSILEDLKFLSYTRKLNAINAWGLVLTGISFNKVYDARSKRLSYAKLIQQLEKLNPNLLCNHQEKIDLANEMCTKKIGELDYFQITQGHDFISCLQCHCLGSIFGKKKKPSCGSLFDCLLSAYSLETFRGTELYKNVNRYQYNNSIDEIFI